MVDPMDGLDALFREDRPCAREETAIKYYAVLMTVHNRRDQTLGALRRLAQQRWDTPTVLMIYVVDDGSTDGTQDAIRQEFPEVQIITGDGSLFWNGGMRRAFAAAFSAGYDGYFWLNDDTMLDDDACQRLIRCASFWQLAHGPAIVTGSVKDPSTSHHTYGGFAMKRGALKADLVPVVPDDLLPTICDTMNGNFVYIPRIIAQAIGNLEQRFTHQLGDIDYGLRTRQLSFGVVVAPAYFGVCESNATAGTWRDHHLPFRERWRNLMSPKGAPPREWLLFVRRHYGWRWPLYALSPYVKTLYNGALHRVKR